MHPESEIISAENLVLMSRETGRRILDSFSIKVKKGSIHSLVGASGSGKSSFSYVLLNLLRKNLKLEYKSLRLLEREFHEIKEWEQIRGREIVYLPQNPAESFHPYLSVKTQILDFLHKNEKFYNNFQLIELLSKFSIKNPDYVLNSKPNFLSGGERQRVLLAISSEIQPKILIADEPTTALDSINEKLVLKDLLRLKSENQTTILLITHDRRIVKELADDVTVMREGRSIESFTMKNGTFPQLKEDYTKKLLLERRN